ncbi:hypothetical protein K523DRAFT_326510 [Schizophyllum commune Tattone D]|nr:hypothetical protein K523DRAFT_326510 [Schizophyllum commune Tattone D]
MLDLPADTIAAHAFRDALALYAAGQPGWIGNLATGLRRLEPIAVHIDFLQVRSAAHVDTVIAHVEASAHDGVCRDLTAASRTHLLRNRVEADKCGGQSSQAIQYRAYLDVETWLPALCGVHSAIPRVAKYVHDVLYLFSLHRMPPREGWEKTKGRTKETDRD